MFHIYQSSNGFHYENAKLLDHDTRITEDLIYHGMGTPAQVPGYHAAHVFEVSSSAVVHDLALLKPLLIAEVNARYELLKAEIFAEFQIAHFDAASETDLNVIRTKETGLAFNRDEKIAEIGIVGSVYDALAIDHDSYDHVVVIPPVPPTPPSTPLGG